MSGVPLLDVTRAIGRAWTGRAPNGIDRVAEAYIHRFAGRVRAVYQVHGRPLILGEEASTNLLEGLALPRNDFRRHLVSTLANSAFASDKRSPAAGNVYLNVTHTDFDLAGHGKWVRTMGLRPVYFLHDLIPLTHPDVTTPHKVARHRGRVKHALDQATGIVVGSRCTLRDLTNFASGLGAGLPPILVAPLGVTGPSHSEMEAREPKPYFVCVGTIEPRKNHALLVDAWRLLIRRLGKEAPRLLIIGRLGLKSSWLLDILKRDPELTEFIEIRNGLGDAPIAELVKHARALLMPSKAEGFGLPVVEALAMHVPVIASDIPALREVGQGIPALLDPENVEDWAAAVAAYCGETPDRARQLAAFEGFMVPSWDEHFALLDDWLPTLCVHPAHRRADNPTAHLPGSALKLSLQQGPELRC